MRFTGVVSLAGGRTSMQIVGEDEVFYADTAGGGLLFRSALKHGTRVARKGIFKFTVFFGWFLESAQVCMPAWMITQSIPLLELTGGAMLASVPAV